MNIILRIKNAVKSNKKYLRMITLTLLIMFALSIYFIKESNKSSAQQRFSAANFRCFKTKCDVNKSNDNLCYECSDYHIVVNR